MAKAKQNANRYYITNILHEKTLLKEVFFLILILCKNLI